MAENIKYEKIKEYLNEVYLGWVIVDSISHSKLVSLMSRLGIDYPGIRMSSLPHQELAYDLAHESFIHIEVMEVVIKALNELNSAVIEKISLMPENEVERLVCRPNGISSIDIKIGRVIWALLADSRNRINELISQLLNSLEEFMKKEEYIKDEIHRESEKKASNLFSKKGHKKLLDTIALLKEEISMDQRASGNLEAENKRLREKNIQQQRIIEQLHRTTGELTRGKGVWHTQIQRKETEIQNLIQQIKELKNRLDVGPKMRLKSEIHRLQKENDKLNYALQKKEADDKVKIDTIERELGELKEKIQQSDQFTLTLQEKLEIEKCNLEEVQKKYQSLSTKKEHALTNLPKEKGRRLGIFIDNQNVYYSAKMHFAKKVDYLKLLGTLVRDRHLVKAICYLVKHPEVSYEAFINMLKNSGYTVKTRDLIRRADGSAKGNWDIGIAADVITMVEKNALDIVILVTCDGDFVDLIKLLSAKGIKVEVVGFSMNMAMDLKNVADEYYFISEELMVNERN